MFESTVKVLDRLHGNSDWFTVSHRATWNGCSAGSGLSRSRTGIAWPMEFATKTPGTPLRLTVGTLTTLTGRGVFVTMTGAEPAASLVPGWNWSRTRANTPRLTTSKASLANLFIVFSFVAV